MEDRFRLRAWDKESNKYIEDKDVWVEYCGDFNTIYDLIKDNNSYYVFEQCSGLRDKNEKLIYEGDIIKVTPPDSWNEFEEYRNSEALGKKAVIMSHGAFLTKGENTEEDYWLYWVVTNTDVEVIGNIHENSELLEEN